ncbi:MAG: hypothetical protein HPZ79_06875 [Oscillospiraceae bacterium]|nr:hypothetical protein [Oscillospiraceae bacterium]
MLSPNIPEILYLFNNFCGYFNNDELVRAFHKPVKTLTVQIAENMLTNLIFSCHNKLTQAASASPGEATQTLTPNRSLEVEGCKSAESARFGAAPCLLAWLFLLRMTLAL